MSTIKKPSAKKQVKAPMRPLNQPQPSTGQAMINDPLGTVKALSSFGNMASAAASPLGAYQVTPQPMQSLQQMAAGGNQYAQDTLDRQKPEAQALADAMARQGTRKDHPEVQDRIARGKAYRDRQLDREMDRRERQTEERIARGEDRAKDNVTNSRPGTHSGLRYQDTRQNEMLDQQLGRQQALSNAETQRQALLQSNELNYKREDREDQQAHDLSMAGAENEHRLQQKGAEAANAKDIATHEAGLKAEESARQRDHEKELAALSAKASKGDPKALQNYYEINQDKQNDLSRRRAQLEEQLADPILQNATDPSIAAKRERKQAELDKIEGELAVIEKQTDRVQKKALHSAFKQDPVESKNIENLQGFAAALGPQGNEQSVRVALKTLQDYAATTGVDIGLPILPEGEMDPQSLDLVRHQALQALMQMFDNHAQHPGMAQHILDNPQ